MHTKFKLNLSGYNIYWELKVWIHYNWWKKSRLAQKKIRTKVHEVEQARIWLKHT
jgi:hypothetical protein